MLKQIKTKHFKAFVVSNSIINFETRPSKTIITDYIKNKENSILAKEFMEIIEKLRSSNKVKTIKIKSFLLNDKRSYTFIKICKQYNAICTEKKANIFTDIFPFVATSIIILNFKNIKRIKLKIKECIINL